MRLISYCQETGTEEGVVETGTRFLNTGVRVDENDEGGKSADAQCRALVEGLVGPEEIKKALASETKTNWFSRNILGVNNLKTAIATGNGENGEDEEEEELNEMEQAIFDYLSTSMNVKRTGKWHYKVENWVEHYVRNFVTEFVDEEYELDDRVTYGKQKRLILQACSEWWEKNAGDESKAVKTVTRESATPLGFNVEKMAVLFRDEDMANYQADRDNDLIKVRIARSKPKPIVASSDANDRMARMAQAKKEKKEAVIERKRAEKKIKNTIIPAATKKAGPGPGEKAAQKANDKCKCGSGKKFKKCCFIQTTTFIQDGKAFANTFIPTEWKPNKTRFQNYKDFGVGLVTNAKDLGVGLATSYLPERLGGKPEEGSKQETGIVKEEQSSAWSNAWGYVGALIPERFSGGVEEEEEETGLRKIDPRMRVHR